ncbi:MAG: baseplate J/gp47 family protein [Spirochaetaceae bacterium]|jgi:phage-related baseplate assembly protein|nr:baseplate J/gp47 family protein [Spirochaetaceae bacterium]
MAFSDLQFSETDARKIQDRLQRVYEEVRRAAGEPGYRLAQAAPERLVQLSEAAALTQIAADIDKTGKGNLLYFADEETIEHIGILYGERGKRLPASSALTTIRYTLSTIRSTPTIIPKGNRTTPDNKIFFATKNMIEIPAGELHGDVEAECAAAGMAGMGFEPGDIANMVDVLPFVAKAENITPTSGGADKEGIEAYRDRLRLLPESFSAAGPDGAYEFWARTANSGIADAKVWMPELDVQSFANFLEPWGITDAAGFYNALGDYYRESGTGPGNVNITVLMRDGELPSEEILNQVKETLSGKTRRPLTDYVHVVEPRTIEFDIAVRYWIETEKVVEAASIIDAVDKAIGSYITWQTSRLGLDILPDTLHKFIMDCGVKRLEITAPVFHILAMNEAARFSGNKTVTYEGFEEA